MPACRTSGAWWDAYSILATVSLNDSALSPKRLSRRRPADRLTSNGSRTPRFPAEPSRAILALLGESNNFERWRLVFLSLFSPEFLGRSLGKTKNLSKGP